MNAENKVVFFAVKVTFKILKRREKESFSEATKFPASSKNLFYAKSKGIFFVYVQKILLVHHPPTQSQAKVIIKGAQV